MLRALTLCLLAAAFAIPAANSSAAAPHAALTSSSIKLVESPKAHTGRLGFAILDLQTSQTYAHNGRELFPLQSVFKAMLGAEVLRQVDEGKLSLDQPVEIGAPQLAMLWSPIADKYDGTTTTYTVRQLLEGAVGISDNTAADVLMEMVGGPAAVTENLKAHGIDSIHINRYERQFQPELRGMRPFEIGEVITTSTFEKATLAVPPQRQLAALDNYIYCEDERDCATPIAAVQFLAALQQGDLLSSASTALLLDIMTKSPTGATRIKAGVPPGALVAQKTGSGGELQGIDTASNDIGIVTLPDGRQFIIAIFLAGSKDSEAARDALMADITRQAIKLLQPPQQ